MRFYLVLALALALVAIMHVQAAPSDGDTVAQATTSNDSGSSSPPAPPPNNKDSQTTNTTTTLNDTAPATNATAANATINGTTTAPTAASAEGSKPVTAAETMKALQADALEGGTCNADGVLMCDKEGAPYRLVCTKDASGELKYKKDECTDGKVCSYPSKTKKCFARCKQTE